MRGTTVCAEHIRKNRAIYIAALAAYLAGICLGAGMAASAGAEQSEALAGELERFLSQNGGETGLFDVMKVCVAENFKYTAFSFLVSLSVWTVAANALLLGFKGFSAGFTAGFAVRCYRLKGTLFSAAALLPSCVVTLPAYLLICVMCVRFAVTRHRERAHLSAVQTRKDVLWFAVTIALLFAVLCVCSLADAFVSPTLIRLFF